MDKPCKHRNIIAISLSIPQPGLLQTGGGVHSAETEVQALAAGVKVIAIPAVGKISPLRQAVERTRSWRRAYRWRAGIGGRIASLRRDYGLRKCLYHGQEGMERRIGFGIIGSRPAPYRSGSSHQSHEKAGSLAVCLFRSCSRDGSFFSPPGLLDSPASNTSPAHRLKTNVL